MNFYKLHSLKKAAENRIERAANANPRIQKKKERDVDIL